MKLFMLLLGCKPPGRNTEQHDVFFGIGETLQDLIPEIFSFWPEARQKIHLDAWREITYIDGHIVQVVPRQDLTIAVPETRLFFLNLGGYKQEEFEEYHYKMLVACKDRAEAIQRARQTAFFKHTGFKGANSHIDEKYGVDVDDIHEIGDILSPEVKKNYAISLKPLAGMEEDELQLGYVNLVKLITTGQADT
jgi:hypothetical protein